VLGSPNAEMLERKKLLPNQIHIGNCQQMT